MAFITFCNNKGCGKEQTPLLDTETNTVLCGECDMPITSLTQFAINQMKSLGQTVNKNKAKKTFSVKCETCGKEGRPIINQNDLCCEKCKSKLNNISKPFELLVRQSIKNDNS